MLFKQNGATFLKKVTSGKIVLNLKDRLLLALAYAKALKDFHDHNQVLLDFRPRNSEITIKDLEITVKPITTMVLRKRREEINLNLYIRDIKKFSAPELFNCLIKNQYYSASFRSDIFSLGLIFMRLFYQGNRVNHQRSTLYPPIFGNIADSPNGLIDLILLPSLKLDLLQKPFCELIEKMLMKDMSKRPYINDIVTTLETMMSTLPIAMMPPQIFSTCQHSPYFDKTSDPYDADDEDEDNPFLFRKPLNPR